FSGRVEPSDLLVLSAIMAQTIQKYDPVFLEAVTRVLADEGGFVCNPADPGGETNFGISKRSYPSLDIKSLTRDQAIEIYWNDFWQKPCFYRLKGDVAIKVFDLSVMMGAVQAVKCLQRAIRACSAGTATIEDGELGIATTQAANSWPNTIALLAAIRSE